MTPYRTAAPKTTARPTSASRWALRALPVALALVKRPWRRRAIAQAQATHAKLEAQTACAVELHARYLAGEMGAERYATKVLAVVGAARVREVVGAMGDAQRIAQILGRAA